MKILIVSFVDDNFGDNLIRICFENLLKVVLKNLEVKSSDTVIRKMPLKRIDLSLIQDSDLILFAGGGLFGLSYLNFLPFIEEILKAAEEKEIPVIFSSIGINNMDATGENEGRLREILKSRAIFRFAARENTELFQHYAPEKFAVETVCDPAVWTKYVYSGDICKVRAAKERTLVGVNVVRGGLFKDNKKNWKLGDEIAYLNELRTLLEENGYDYKFYTNGSFLDNNTLRYYAKEYQIPEEHLAFPDTTGELVRTVAEFDYVIAIRMHSSIISYALDIPAANPVWNDKIPFFYQNIGHPERAVPLEQWSAKEGFRFLRQFEAEGSEPADSEYMMSVYRFLYESIADLKPEHTKRNGMFDFCRVAEELEKQAVSLEEDTADIRLKLKKAERYYLSMFIKDRKNMREIAGLKEKLERTSKMTENTKPMMEAQKPYNILLLTNRDSDNTGDQVIEACDIGLLSAVMKNLKITNYKLQSRAANIVSEQYLKSRDPKLLETAQELIQKADLVVFGGAPQFNYRYQKLYEKTAVTLELAQQYHTPVIFSAMGVEGYDGDNPKCQRLKRTLNFDCVKQITTRDDLESLQKFVESDRIFVDRVADPAVHAQTVFRNFRSGKGEGKKIGLFVLRANGFKDNENNINFTRNEAAEFWKELIGELEKNGYEYELLTSGHFGDEVFLSYLIEEYHVDANNCVFNVNTPEELVARISSCDAVISCRLHPSIISYAMDVPSLGIVWNPKVKYFYRGIGCEDRLIDSENIAPKKIVKKIGEVIAEGVSKDEDYRMSVYRTLFDRMKELLRPDENIAPYGYSELVENIPPFEETSEAEKKIKLERKFKRVYRTYNQLFARVNEERTEQKYSVFFNTGESDGTYGSEYPADGRNKLIKTRHGLEYQPEDYFLKNDGASVPMENRFTREGYRFAGWNVRFKVNGEYFWYLKDGGVIPQSSHRAGDAALYLIRRGEPVPTFYFRGVERAVLTAVWLLNYENTQFDVYYYTEKPQGRLLWNYAGLGGQVVKNPSGSYEYRCSGKFPNDGTIILKRNGFIRKRHRFVGWRLRIKCKGRWYWYMKDGSLELYSQKMTQEEFTAKKKVFPDQAALPVLPLDGISLVVAEAVWEKK